MNEIIVRKIFFSSQCTHLATLSFNSADLRIDMLIVHDLSGIFHGAMAPSRTPQVPDGQPVLGAFCCECCPCPCPCPCLSISPLIS